MSIGVMLFCPFTGKPRHPSDIASDPKGVLVWDGEESLRAAKPAQQPLTDEQIRDLWSWSMTPEAERTAPTQQHAFARAIEAAHGIKEQP